MSEPVHTINYDTGNNAFRTCLIWAKENREAANDTLNLKRQSDNAIKKSFKAKKQQGKLIVFCVR